MTTRVHRFAGIALIALCLTGCARVAGTGRTQLILTTPAMEAHQGAAAYRSIIAEETLSDDRAMTAIVERVGRRLAAVAPDPGFDWEFTLLASDTANAFALPGGKVAIYTGILRYCETEAGLAAVMDHEIAHAIARHGGERMSQGIVVAGAGVALDAYLQNQDVEPTERNLWLGAFALGSQLGVMLPYSRAHELEADHLGLRYMAAAGYDPRAAPAFWRRFATGASATPEFLSTHPASDRRARELAADLPAALERYRRASEQFGHGVRLPARYLDAD